MIEKRPTTKQQQKIDIDDTDYWIYGNNIVLVCGWVTLPALLR
jgi:hypothetical protein